MDALMEVDDSNFLWEDAVVGGDELEGKDFENDEEDFRVDEIEEDIEGDEFDEEDAGADENIEPSLGMEFSSIGEAQQFYKSYGSRLLHITLHHFYSDWQPETHRVQIDKTEEIVSCSCKGYEFNGLLCAHSVKVMQHVGMQNIPSKYIVKRWTKGANDNIKEIMKEINVDMRVSLELESTRYAKLYPKLMEIGRMVAKSEAAFKLVDANLDEMKVKVMTMISSTSNVNGQQPIGAIATSVTTRCEAHTSAASSPKKAPLDEYTDPPLSLCKGRKKRPQRLKPILEKLPPKRRTCSYCDKQAGHNFRSCPERLSKHKSKKSDSESD